MTVKIDPDVSFLLSSRIVLSDAFPTLTVPNCYKAEQWSVTGWGALGYVSLWSGQMPFFLEQYCGQDIVFSTMFRCSVQYGMLFYA